MVEKLGMKTGKRNSANDAEKLKQIQALIADLLSDEEAEVNEENPAAKSDVSLEAAYREVQEGFNSQLGYNADSFIQAVPSNCGYMVDATDEYVIAEFGNVYYKIPYNRIDGKVSFVTRDQWVEVEKQIAWEEAVKSLKTNKPMNLSYAKSIGLVFPDAELVKMLSVKSVGVDMIRHPVFIWGNANKKDIEGEYFDRNTNFWDKELKGASRPLTWDHMQDPTMKSNPVIGQTVEFEDDEVARWAISQLDRSHRYRKAVDMLIEKGALGSSSDTALQYVIRQPTKSGATYISQWPWFSSALTTTPAEPRTTQGVEYFKSLGIKFEFPDAPENEQARAMKETLKAKFDHLRKLME